MVSRLTCTGTLYFRATGTTGDNYTVVPSERRLRHLRCCLAPSAQQAASSASVELGADEEAVYSLAQVSEHADRRSAWVALNGGVYDFTSFLGAHPGGARSVLRHAGTDATAIFGELHSDSIFATFAPAYRIGTLLEDGTAAPTSLPGPIGKAVAPPAVHDTLLASPFPHDVFEGTGLESARFVWAAASHQSGFASAAAAQQQPPPSATATARLPPQQASHVHRQKSNLSVLDTERDWLHLGSAEEYSGTMCLKRELLGGGAAAASGHMQPVYVAPSARSRCYVSRPQDLPAETEVLGLVLAWVERRCPSRIRIDREARTVETLTEGYRFLFFLDDWELCPLRLVGQLVQEDFFLLTETDLEDFAGGSGGDAASGDEEEKVAQVAARRGLEGIAGPAGGYDERDHREDHPSERQHVFVSGTRDARTTGPFMTARCCTACLSVYIMRGGCLFGCVWTAPVSSACSCLSFDAHDKHMQSMAGIHHPGVGGWRLHLQRHMNRLFTDMIPEMSWCVLANTISDILSIFPCNCDRPCTGHMAIAHGIATGLSSRTHARTHRVAGGATILASISVPSGQPISHTVYPGLRMCFQLLRQSEMLAGRWTGSLSMGGGLLGRPSSRVWQRFVQ